MAPLFAYVVMASGAPLTASMGREHYALINALKNLKEPEFTAAVRKIFAGFAGRWTSRFKLNSADGKSPAHSRLAEWSHGARR